MHVLARAAQAPRAGKRSRQLRRENPAYLRPRPKPAITHPCRKTPPQITTPTAICSASRAFRARISWALLNLAEDAIQASRQVEKKRSNLRGRTQINLFYEASTRTQAFFRRSPAKRLAADVNEDVGREMSSESKGETSIQMATGSNAMRPDIIVVRHSEADLHRRRARVDCSVVNAGDSNTYG